MKRLFDENGKWTEEGTLICSAITRATKDILSEAWKEYDIIDLEHVAISAVSEVILDKKVGLRD